MTQLRFAKMHGCGNDFMVIDGINQIVHLTPALIQRWADRHTGIGFDQILLVERSLNPQALFNYRIFNADGMEVEQCGNGARCFAIFVQYQGLCADDRFWVETKTGLIQLIRHADDQVTVDLGVPQFDPRKLPCGLTDMEPEYELKTFRNVLKFSIVSLGNPHCVVFLPDIEQVDLNLISSTMTSSGLFPVGVNVGIAAVVTPEKIRLRVHERGVGETQACGSGAAAAVIAGIRTHRLSHTVEVELPGGSLMISWPGMGASVKMTGPAVYVYDGILYL